MSERLPELDERLSLIFSLIEPCRRAADIGCDHGFLGARLLLAGRAETVEFLDLREKPLSHARELITRAGLSERAVFTLGDGAAALRETPDWAIIAGMGGPTIASVLERGREKLGRARVVMQPNVGVPELRERLMRVGYKLLDERVIRAGGRRYVVLLAAPGAALYSPEELVLGPILMQRGGAAYRDYAAFRLKVQEKALSGARAGSEGDVSKLEWEVALWRKVLKG